MKETLAVINEMQAAGVIRQYAIGGAVAATFYLEPISTIDLDIFIAFETSSLILTLTPVYEFLAARGYKARQEYIIIGKWPVQFLPIANPLIEEAVAQARAWQVEGVHTRVMTAEHLVAIALQTGRAKDHGRIVHFIESAKLKNEHLQEILGRHGLLAQWQKFSDKYLSA